MSIDKLYQERCATDHNIDQHLPILRGLARQCAWVTEFGTDIGFSTTAFLAAKPVRLRSYDIARSEWVETLAALAAGAGIDYQFRQEDTLTCPIIEETDLLFIDTDHTYQQVAGELKRHGHRSRRFLVFHDIVSNPEIVPAILEYDTANWRVVEWSRSQSGLAVLERRAR